MDQGNVCLLHLCIVVVVVDALLVVVAPHLLVVAAPVAVVVSLAAAPGFERWNGRALRCYF